MGLFMSVVHAAVPAATRQRAEMLARFFRGLDDPTRVLILQLLLEGEKTVSELVTRVGSPQGRVSTHLGCLRYCGYVRSRREGRNVYYRLADDRVRTLLRIAQELMADHAQELLSCAVVSPDLLDATVHGLKEEWSTLATQEDGSESASPQAIGRTLLGRTTGRLALRAAQPRRSGGHEWQSGA